MKQTTNGDSSTTLTLKEYYDVAILFAQSIPHPKTVAIKLFYTSSDQTSDRGDGPEKKGGKGAKGGKGRRSKRTIAARSRGSTHLMEHRLLCACITFGIPRDATGLTLTVNRRQQTYVIRPIDGGQGCYTQRRRSGRDALSKNVRMTHVR